METRQSETWASRQPSSIYPEKQHSNALAMTQNILPTNFAWKRTTHFSSEIVEFQMFLTKTKTKSIVDIK